MKTAWAIIYIALGVYPNSAPENLATFFFFFDARLPPPHARTLWGSQPHFGFLISFLNENDRAGEKYVKPVPG